jgi:hypothetical protein
VAKIVNCEHRSGGGEIALLFASIKTNRDHSCRPIVGVHYIRKPVEGPTELKSTPAEKRKALKIVSEAGLASGSIDAVTPIQDVVVEKVDRHVGAGKPALIDGAPLFPFTQRHPERSTDALQAADVDRVVAR